MKNFYTKHKRAIIIVLIALIIIGVAYYFTLGKDLLKRNSTSSTSTGSDSSGSSSSPSPTVTTSNTFPIKWGVYNSFTVNLQKRLNLSITTCNLGTRIAEDGILGSQTLGAIKRSFPNIGASVETNRYITQSQYSTIVNSQPNCV